MTKNLCKKCDIKIRKYCCYQSVLAPAAGGKMYNIILKNHPCKFLDPETSLCMVYEKRFELNPYCLPMNEAIRQNALQADCLYVKGNKTYDGAIPKIAYVPDDVLKYVKVRIKEVEAMNPSEFRRKFLPLIL